LEVTTENAFANTVTVIGETNTMTVQVDHQSLTAIKYITIDANGVVELDDSGTLVSATVDVRSGGLLAGNGTIVGNVKVGTVIGPQEATFSPGFPTGQFDIEGSYEQGTSGVLEIDVEGTALEQVDTVDVTGEARLGGTMRVILANAMAVDAGDTITLMTAGSFTPDTVFEQVVTTGTDDLFLAVNYPNLSGGSGGSNGGSGSSDPVQVLSGQWYERGDMNHFDGVDEDDVDYFALALRDTLAYINSKVPNGNNNIRNADWGTSAGDFAGGNQGQPDGTLDFDDIPLFLNRVNMSMAAFMEIYESIGATVPEPSSSLLVVVGGLVTCGLRCRRRPCCSR
jgi:hypothetical protein